MNKIIVAQEEKSFKNEDIIITEIKSSHIKIHLDGKVNCGIINIPEKSKLEFYLHQNCIVNIDFFLQLNNCYNEIYIYSEDNTILNFNYSCTFNKENTVKIYNDINSNNTSSKIYIRAVENKGVLNLEAQGFIKENTFENNYLEDIKILVNDNNSIKISPNLLVKTNAVVANHNTTISNVSEDELFYLACRGISREKAMNLIKAGFLKEPLKIKEIKEEVKAENA